MQIEASQKKVRGPGSATLELREGLLMVLQPVDKPVTVRQAYYLASSNGLVDKDESGYGRVQRQLLAMRQEGQLSYDWIADNTRWMIQLDVHTGLDDYLAEAQQIYRRDLWADTDDRIEVWCEKDSIAGVLSAVTQQYRVPLLPARGYSSETFAYESAARANADDRLTTIYYVGDLDPSGWHMSRNLESKLMRFCNEIICFERLALEPHHIDQFNLQTRPTKKTDARCRMFYEALGKGHPSVELEAMHPDTLRGFVRKAIERHVDKRQLAAVLSNEKAERETLAEFRRGLAQAGVTV